MNVYNRHHPIRVLPRMQIFGGRGEEAQEIGGLGVEIDFDMRTFLNAIFKLQLGNFFFGWGGSWSGWGRSL